jgi:CelD/BcsL family acetyltransferase involved in cellulose biosynthesis
MRVELIRPHELDADLAARWRKLLAGRRGFDSPFFQPGYIQILGEYRPQLEIGIVRDGPNVVGFFPFERHRRSVGRPPGGKLCDFQGPILDPQSPLTIADLLKGGRLSVWHYDHLLSDGRFDAHTLRTAPSPYLDLSQGYESYVAERKRSGTDVVSQTLRKSRKLAREVGPLRLVWNCEDDQVFDALMAWKQEQRARTRTFDILEFDWVQRALQDFRRRQDDCMGGVLSALYAGDQLAAAHFGIRSSTVLHYWFPAYNRNLQRYSPGSIILLQLAEAAAGRGIVRVDLGKGNDPYKTNFESGALAVQEGAADLRVLPVAARAAWFHVREWIKASPLRAWATGPKRWIRQLHCRRTMQ